MHDGNLPRHGGRLYGGFQTDFPAFGEILFIVFNLANLDRMLARCEETNLVLNWEKCHFMVKEGIVLGHKISGAGIEVDKAKIDLLMKDAKFNFFDDCKKAFNILKEKLTTVPIIISPDWNVPFELMCDASDFAIGAILGQQIDGKFKPIYYASKTLNNAQEHYTTTEKELLAVVFSFDKFCQYLILSKTIVYTDHSALKYLFSKKDVKPRLIRLRTPDIGTFTEEEITNEFPDEHLIILKAELNNDEPWLRGDKDFKAGDKVFLFNSRFKMHQGKLKLKRYDLNVVKTVHPYGTVEIIDKNGISFKVNGQRLKKYHDGYNNEEEKEVIELNDDTM
ncbi:reverse transcriptase domain-containing protein [Tanacetum coccineum]